MNEDDEFEDIKRENERHHDKKEDEKYQQKRLKDELQTEKWALGGQRISDVEADLILADMRSDIAVLEEEEERKKSQERVEKAEALLAEMNKEKEYILNKLLKSPIPIRNKNEWHKALEDIDLRFPGAIFDLSSLLVKIAAITVPDVSHKRISRRSPRERPHVNLVELRLQRRKRGVKKEIEIIESELRDLIRTKRLYDELNN